MVRIFGSLVFFFVCSFGTAFAHFGMAIPSTSVMVQEQRNVDLVVSFSHPFELVGMDMQKPVAFYVVKDGKKVDLLLGLTGTKVMQHRGWQTSYRVNRPGVYQFVVEPVPYWESAEDVSIIHYTKTIVAAYGGDMGWGEPVGLPTEIVSMLRPFGNYVGNSFVGKVLVQGKSVANVEVEVEFYNEGVKLQAASDYHITQVVKTDANGIFSFTCPRAGWWGFAALTKADYTLKNPEGLDKDVELGAVLWVHMDGYVVTK